MGEQIKGDCERIKHQYSANRSKEYWTGWALAYYQWITSLSFAEIIKYIPINDIVELYIPYHEMDIRQFIDKMNELYKLAKLKTNVNTFIGRAFYTVGL